jgi:hypothetical protein
MKRSVLVIVVLLATCGVSAAVYAGWRAVPQYNQVHHSPYVQP